MAISFYKIYFKYTKCLAVTVLIAFFVQIFIAINLFPTTNNGLHLKSPAYNFDKNVESESRIEEISQDLYNKPLSHLRIEELDFKPICEIKSREAISAIHRAKTQVCKQLIINKTCLIERNQFYPEVLPHYCFNKDNSYKQYIGCYQDEKKIRLLTGLYGNYMNTNSPSTCLEICVRAGFPFAGVQYGTECFCGDNIPPSSSKLADEFCDMKCPGDNSQFCGGYFTMNVFRTGLKKFVPRIPRNDTNDQQSVNIVFLLTLNGRALRQVYRLINCLYRMNHYFYIHVDARQDYLHRKLSELENTFPNIKLAKKRYSTIWGGASLLKMLLSSMQDIILLGWKWDFVMNLSESDFPIKSLEQLESFLSVNKGLNFVKSHGREVQRFIKKQGLDKTFIECETHMWRVGDRKLPKGIVIDGGSDWIALSPDFVTYVIDKQNELLKGLEVIFEHTLLPAESYFHTVLRNSNFCNTYVDNNLHVTNWKRKLGCKCQYRHVVDWCGCSPNDFRTEDWPRILNTQERQLFFARKFEPIINQDIITRVEQFVGFSDQYLLPNLEAYWQSIYDIEDMTASSDDLLLTHARSLVRHNAKIFLQDGCKLHPKEIIQISSYNYADTYKGNLILHKVDINNNELLMETWYKPLKNMELNFENKYSDHIKNFVVSSEYDQKENTFRNFANILGPFSEPILLYQFSEPLEKNFTVIWTDPTGVVADVNNINIEDNNLTNFIKPVLKVPLLPGIWKVGLSTQSDLVVSTRFLISPLEYFSDKKLSFHDAAVIHAGSQNSYKNYSYLNLSNLKPRLEDKLSLQKSSLANKRIEFDLTEWIDSLNKHFYRLLKSCFKTLNYNRDKMMCGNHELEYCVETEWSSLSPDPKGSLGKLNKKTGRLERVFTTT